MKLKSDTLIKSKGRVQELGEVYTPSWLINQMLDKVTFTKDSKFLEPTCGIGNFLVEIFDRLTKKGADPLTALSNIYGADICNDNVVTSRERLLQLAIEAGADSKKAAAQIKQNIVKANFLKALPFQKVKFNVIIGNPPYQEDATDGTPSKPLYDEFIRACLTYKHRQLSMVIPAKWYVGGKNLDPFLEEMMNDNHIKYLADYRNDKEIFPEVNIRGGVMWFVRDALYQGECTVENFWGGKKVSSLKRSLSKYPIIIRDNKALPILDKVIRKHFGTSKRPIEDHIVPMGGFGIETLPTDGTDKPTKQNTLGCHALRSYKYISPAKVRNNIKEVNNYKVLIPAAYGGDLWTPYSYIVIAKPGEVCSITYTMLASFDAFDKAFRFAKYMQTKLVSLLITFNRLTQHSKPRSFRFVPIPREITYNDTLINNYYGLTEEEVAYLDSMTLKKVRIIYEGEIVDV